MKQFRYVLVVAIGLAAWMLPTQAHALTPAIACPAIYPSTCGGTAAVYHSDRPSYVGWAMIDNRTIDCANCMYLPGVAAYRWTASGWRGTSLAEGTRVYAYPYATGWTWVWTQVGGWMAARSNHVKISSATTYTCNLDLRSACAAHH
jgi:hypothetical protein